MPWDISIDSLALSSQVENLREMYYVHPSLTRPTLEDVAPETYAFLTACELLAEMEQIDYQLKQLHTSSLDFLYNCATLMDVEGVEFYG